MIQTYPKCRDSRKCFAKNQFNDCTILKEVARDGECRFCKPYKEVTKGRTYPHNKQYSQS